MANSFLTTDEITLEALAVLENQLTFTKQIRRQYDSYFAVQGAKIGDTLRVRKPARYIGRTGQGYSPEAITETYTNVTLTTQYGVDMEMSSADLALRIDEFSDRILKPAVVRIANKIDQDGLALATQVSNFVGTPGTPPANLSTYFDAGVILDNNAAMDGGDRCAVISPRQQATIANAVTSFFNPGQQISDAYRKGRMGNAANFEFYKDQNVYMHTIGTSAGSTPLANNAAEQTGSSIITDGWAVSTQVLNAGDIITFAGVYGVNPQSYQSTGELQQFVVTTNVTSSGGGAATIPIYPSIVTSGAFQNCTAGVANNAAILIWGAAAGTYDGVVTPQGLAFHPDAFTCVSADLPIPKGVDMAGRKKDDQLGFSIRFIRDYDPVRDFFVNRLDVLYGWAGLRQENLAVRVCG